MFRLCFARPPRAVEEKRLRRYYEQAARDFESVDKVYPARGIEGVDRRQAAVLVGVASVLLNLDEFITRN
jgi:hypothetical protein